MSIYKRNIDDVRLIDDIVIRVPEISRVHAEKTLRDFHEAFNPDNRIITRVMSFLSGETKLGRRAGIIVDFVSIFVPFRVNNARQFVRRVINRKKRQEEKMNGIKKKLKNASFWEGIAAILGAIGITINPAAIVEIVTGVFVIWGGIEMWKDE